ncbi:MAG: serine/threonine-protein kinase [Cyanobacteriota bacterium]
MSDLLSELSKNYTIEKELGRGGMGTVYLALDNRLERQVAIKVLEISGSNQDVDIDEAVQRFKREAKAIAKLSHTNIVNIYDVGNVKDQYYMVMEYIDGKPLSDILKDQKKLPVELTINIVLQICSALDYAHDNGIVHRDIKPDNIMLSRKGLPKLTDFGIAQLSKEKKRLTQTGALLGSMMYISPEQLEDSGSVDHRADIYSLGATLYELLTAKVPFDGNNLGDMVFKIMREIPKPVTFYDKNLPLAADLVISKALEKDPSRRYQRASDMGREISKLFNSEISAVNINNIFSTNSSKNEQNEDNFIIGGNKNTSFRTTSLKKTSINSKLIKELKSDYNWIDRISNTWKSESIKLNLSETIKKVIEPSLFGQAFTGLLLIDNNVYCFIHDSYFVGALDTDKLITGQNVFDFLSEKSDNIVLKIPNEKDIMAPLIISSIISGHSNSIHKDLDSSIVDLMPVIDNLEAEKFTGYIKCYTDKNVFYAGFFQGSEIFFTCLNNHDELANFEIKNIRNLLISSGVIFNAYKIKTEIIGPSIKDILKESELKFKYLDQTKSNLYNILDLNTDEIPIHIVKEVKNNTHLDFRSNIDKEISFTNDDIQTIEEIARKTIYLNFCDWMINEYFYLINSSGNTLSLKYIYSWIPSIEKFKFFETLKGEDGNNYNFSIVAHGEVKGEGYKKILFLVRFGDGSKNSVDTFLEESTQVKKKLIKSGDIGSAIYVSTEEFSSDSLKLFYEKTVEPRKGFGLSSLDRLTKYKGFVRIGFGRGFHLNLIEYNKKDHSFSVIAPLLK